VFGLGWASKVKESEMDLISHIVHVRIFWSGEDGEIYLLVMRRKVILFEKYEIVCPFGLFGRSGRVVVKKSGRSSHDRRQNEEEQLQNPRGKEDDEIKRIKKRKI
jgi:hypothetical protein